MTAMSSMDAHKLVLRIHTTFFSESGVRASFQQKLCFQTYALFFLVVWLNRSAFRSSSIFVRRKGARAAERGNRNAHIIAGSAVVGRGGSARLQLFAIATSGFGNLIFPPPREQRLLVDLACFVAHRGGRHSALRCAASACCAWTTIALGSEQLASPAAPIFI